MSKKVIIQKRVYLSGQHREETGEPYPSSNWREQIIRTVMSDEQAQVEYNFKKKPYEFFPEYKTDSKHTRHICGWSGLRKMFPFIDDDKNVECLITLVTEADVYGINEKYEIDEYKQDKELYNFHTECKFFIVDTDYGIMMSKDKNTLFWETDNGYVKWDAGARNNATTIDDEHPLYDFFPVPYANDKHGQSVPYEAMIIVDACI